MGEVKRIVYLYPDGIYVELPYEWEKNGSNKTGETDKEKVTIIYS